MPNPSRRQFLSAGLMLPVAGAASKFPILQSDRGAGRPAAGPPNLDHRTIGKTGLKVTTVGMGCMITSDPTVITRAADLGITYFDTARGYQHGNNERMVGTALGAKRKQVVLSTKSHSFDKASLLADLDTSLSELKTDFVDIWYLHSRDNPKDITDEMIEAQQIARQQGKIRFAGMSTHALPKMADWTVTKKAFDVVLTVCNFSIDKTVEDAMAAVAATGTGVVGMKVMAGGAHGFGPSNPIRDRLGREGAMLAALKWVLHKPFISTTIPSMTDMDQLDENVRAMAEPFSGADDKLLTAHLDEIRPLYCSMCGQCDGDCAKGLPVADMLRILTYADGYGQFALARERFLELPAHVAAVRCGDCAECTVECPHGVKVRARLSRAQEILA
jgi:predicted aldo/keto reductase-like oxidoreductase